MAIIAAIGFEGPNPVVRVFIELSGGEGLVISDTLSLRQLAFQLEARSGSVKVGLAVVFRFDATTERDFEPVILGLEGSLFIGFVFVSYFLFFSF